MKIVNVEATFDQGKASVAFDIEEAVIEDIANALTLIKALGESETVNE